MSTTLERFLAIDYGDRRVGLAVGHGDVGMAFPRETIDRLQIPDFTARILELASEEKIQAFVIGMPYHPDPEKQTKLQSKTEDVKKFIADFETKTDLPIFTQDEAFSSEEAKAKTSHLKTKKKKKNKGLVDRAAAAVFLQRFLDEEGWK